MTEMFDKSPLFGPAGFESFAFDDAEACVGMNPAFPTQIDFRQGAIVDGLEVYYNPRSLKHGGLGGSPNSFPLQDGEHIVRVEGKSDAWGGGTIMDLVFTTDRGRNFGKGRPTPADHGYFRYGAPNGYAIFALYGRADRYIRNIGFYARPIESKQGGGIFPGLGSLKFGGK